MNFRTKSWSWLEENCFDYWIKVTIFSEEIIFMNGLIKKFYSPSCCNDFWLKSCTHSVTIGVNTSRNWRGYGIGTLNTFWMNFFCNRRKETIVCCWIFRSTNSSMVFHRSQCCLNNSDSKQCNPGWAYTTHEFHAQRSAYINSYKVDAGLFWWI
jgi:hypothetical protein